MPVQEPDPHDVLHLRDGQDLGFASKRPAGELGKRHAVELTEEEDGQAKSQILHPKLHLRCKNDATGLS